MLSSSCGSLGLEQIDRVRCTKIPIRFIFDFKVKRVPSSALASKSRLTIYGHEEF